MKKRLLSICLTVLLVLSLANAAMAASLGENHFIPGHVPAETDALQSVTPPVHALVLCMAENNLEYSKSDLFTWKSLYYMLSLYGQMDTRAEMTEDELIFPAEVAADYACALFPEFGGLPKVPTAMAELISYDAEMGEYHLARGDEGLANTVLTGSKALSSGLLVEGELVDATNGSVLVRFEAALTPNDGMFGYAVADMRLL